jgi:hypothetical protein
MFKGSRLDHAASLTLVVLSLCFSTLLFIEVMV